eukprot:gnl/TRDRNA2_/TRDRNA2_88136_c0_seq1.p1 gnl/TRDRNA2_/TRDRNA2_88136_c0~~gnl/TRDRNA2_/TRDRNA2_88136_c0_seq1.p1  ORF type:complete len:122 (+),score=19.87 gnl/TRDRNA2_/TRDRNA2_88136_c0_seq1:155-520(+)
MSRPAPDGAQPPVRWRIAATSHSAGFDQLPGGGIVPFLIDWSPNERPHPSETSPSGCSLAALHAWHPDPTSVEKTLEAMGAISCFEAVEGCAPCAVVGQASGTRARLEAVLETPKGRVVLS